MEAEDFTPALFCKLGVVAAIFFTLTLKIAIAVSIAAIVIYRYVVAAVYGYRVMDIMDLNTFASNKKAMLNVCTVTGFS